MKSIVALIGKQQIPNLLPAYFLKPQEMLLVYSEFTEPEFQQLKTLLKESQIRIYGLKCGNVYETVSITQELKSKLLQMGLQEPVGFNLTGGTKAMVLSAYECAREFSGDVMYLKSASGVTHLYQYQFLDNGELELSRHSDIPPLLSIEQFLNAYLGKGTWREAGYSKDIGGVFEEAVGEALQGHVDEIKAGIRFLGNEYGKREQADLDLVIRVRNQFGVIEVKDRNKATLDAIKQLHYLSRLLGTYTKKFWALSCKTSPDHEAVIQATRTEVVELPEFSDGVLSEEAAQRLRINVAEAFK